MNMQPKPEGAVAVLVMGILGLVMCAPLGVAAWIMGNSYEARCRAVGVEPEGIAVVGKVLGMIVTALMVLAVLAGIAMLVLGGGAAAIGH